MENIKKNPLSLQLNADDFLPASNEEKQSLVIMRESVNFWKDGLRRLKKNKIAMVSFVFIIAIAIFAYLLPAVWPYSYSEQVKGSNNLAPFEYSASEQARIDAGEKVFPHIMGTDRMGRDFAVRIMMGTRVSLSVGLIASVLVLIIGATYGAVSAFAGGWVDNIMMRITDILYTIPDILLIILLGMALKEPLESLATKPGFKWMQTLGPNMISIFIIFALLYWVGMARIVRSQILILKESEYVTAARALGASSGRIIKNRHPDRDHHPADPGFHLHRELPELHRSGCCSPAAVSGFSGHRCRQGHEHLPPPADRPRTDDQRDDPGVQPVRRRPARCL